MQAQIFKGKVQAVVGQRGKVANHPLIEKPYRSSFRFRLAYPVLYFYYTAMGRMPKLGRLLLAQNQRERDVMKYAATSTALDRLYDYPGFVGALRENRGNLWTAFCSCLHQNCNNARDVRIRTWIAADLLTEAIKGGARSIVDLAAGSARAPWLAISRTDFDGQLVLIDYSIFSVFNQYLAAAKTGQLGKVPIEPALVLDQDSLRNGSLKKILVRADELRQKLNRQLGLNLTIEQFIDCRPVLPGTLYNRIRDGARVIPIVGDAQNLAGFLGDGYRFHAVTMLGFLDYLTTDETVKVLGQTRELLRLGGVLMTALMAPNCEIDEPGRPSFVRNVPWYYAEKMGLVLKPKTLGEFVELVQQSGYEVTRLLQTPSGVYNIVVAAAC